MRTRMSLRWALALSMVLPLLAAGAAVGFLGVRAMERWAEARLQQEVSLVARAVRLPLADALERGRPGAVEQVLASVFRINRVYAVYVYDAEGRTIASVGTVDPEASRGRLTRIAAEGARRGEYGEVGGREVYSYFVPINGTGGRILGLLHVTRRRSDIQEQVAAMRMPAVGVLSVSLLVILSLVLYGHHGAIGRYLTRLGRSMEHVGGGDRRHRAPVEGPREIASLGATLNAMLDSIEEAEERIRAGRAENAVLEERLRRTEKLAAIGQLAAGVAHELGTPLSVLMGKAQRAERSAAATPAVQRSLEEIRAEVRRMEHIVRQLLDFSRQGRTDRRTVLADRPARAAAAAVLEEAPTAAGNLEISGPAPAPKLCADPLQVEQVLINLLRNALHACPDGRVRLEWFSTADQAGFVVDDAGPGIPPGDRPHIFEPFFTTKPVGEGTGLGLAVTHGIVEAHGGHIEVTTSPLGGARFRVTLPRADEDGSREA